MPDELTALLATLVRIDSVNPALVPGGASEREIAAAIVAWAQAAGLAAEVVDDPPGRPSVLVRAAGTGGGRTLLLCGHIDTVTVENMEDPFAARIAGDRLYGRGAYDMKGGLAAALVACGEAAALSLAGDVVVAAVADEEHASLGVQRALRTIRADAAVVTEPTELEVAIAHKGFAWIELEITGRAAHGSRPHLGIDAIVKAGPILSAVGALDAALTQRTHALLGRASIHASLIEGGAELSSYPDRCRVSLERRTLPGESAGDVEAELTRLLDACRGEDPQLEVRHRVLLVREPFEIDARAPIVRAALEACAEAYGHSAEPVGVSYWADSAFIAAAGIPTVVLGPVGEGAHASEEWVSISSCAATARALVGIARRICS